MNIQSKINKLILALKTKGLIYLVNKEQFYSNKSNKVCTMYKAFHLMPIAEYNKLNPGSQKDSEKYDYVKVEVIKAFRLEEILIGLADIYNKAGDFNGQ